LAQNGEFNRCEPAEWATEHVGPQVMLASTGGFRLPVAQDARHGPRLAQDARHGPRGGRASLRLNDGSLVTVLRLAQGCHGLVQGTSTSRGEGGASERVGEEDE
jgi:hypothetical protein